MRCDILGSNAEFEGPTGKAFRVACPVNCAKFSSGNVFGSMIYNIDSAVCKAAAHAGFIDDTKGG